MANVVVDENVFNRMRNAARDVARNARDAAREWNARRPAGEAEAIEVYKEGHKAQGILSFAGAQAPIVQPLLAGAVIYAVVTSSYFDKIEFFKTHWSLKPLLALLLGYYLFRKRSPWAQAVLAAGAVLLVKAWKERPEKAKEAAGPDDEDAGRWEWDRHDNWRDAERQAHVLGARRAEHNAERLADRIFEHARAA